MHELELKFAVPSYQQSVLRKTSTPKMRSNSAYLPITLIPPIKTLPKRHCPAYPFRRQPMGANPQNSRWWRCQTRWAQYRAAPTGTPDNLDVSSLVPDISLITEPTVVAQRWLIIMPLDELAQTLTVQYFTDVERTSRQIKKNNSRIEIAYDIGKVGIGHLNSQKPANNPG